MIDRQTEEIERGAGIPSFWLCWTIRKSGSQEIRKSGNQEIRKSGYQEIRKSGNQEIRNQEIRKSGNQEIRKSSVGEEMQSSQRNGNGKLSTDEMGMATYPLLRIDEAVYHKS